jgi:2-keto-4-pentenoate hydratase
MTADPVWLDSLARELFTARTSGRAIAPASGRGVELSTGDAYAIQQANTDRRLAEGGRVVGWKIGLTSAAMQAQLGVDAPDSGVLFDDMLLEDGAVVAHGALIAPRIEAEIAVLLDADVAGPGLGPDDIGKHVSAVVPALEIIDSRIADWKITLADTVADNASSALAVAGIPAPGIPADTLRDETVELLIDDKVAARGVGSALLGDPLRSLAWLANRLGGLGQVLPAGTLILAGSVHAAVTLEPGHDYTARYARAGSVTVRIEP